jgi:nucleoside-diphosphate-sugar epimerase
VREVAESRGIPSLDTTYTEGIPEENDIECRDVNSKRIREELGWNPRAFREGVAATVDWFLKNENRWKD